MKKKNVTMIEVSDWDDLVIKTYGKPYNFQQQDECKERGIHELTVPAPANDYTTENVPEVVNHPDMGVSFAAWLARDPKTPLKGDVKSKEPPSDEQGDIDMWWERNFYPNVQMIANDLHAKGLLEPGEYVINIDW